MKACFFSHQWLGLKKNASETVDLLQDGRETPGKEATNGRLRVASPSTGPARTADINFPMRAGKAGRKRSDFVISGSLAALWSRLLPAPEKKKSSDDSVWLRLNGFGSQWRRCFSFVG